MEKSVELERVLGLKDAVGIGLGAIIGAGIFVVTGVAAGVSGPSFIVGLLIAGVIASFNALSSAQLAAVYPQSGGTYEYGYQLLNPVLGFSAGWMFLISKLSAAGVVAIGFGSYFHQLVPLFSPIMYSVTAVILLIVANLAGIQKAGRLNLIIVSLTLLALIYFIVAGIPEIRTHNFTPFAPFGIKGIAEAAALMFFAFTGYARIATLAEEVKSPEKTIPQAVIITIISAIVLYILIAITAVGLIGSEAMASVKSPLQAAAQHASMPGLSIIITIGAATAMLGVLLSQILGISRMMFAMSRRKDLPGFLEKIHPRYKVPQTGILITGAVILVLSVFGNFEFIVRSASFSILLYYSITNLAALQQPAHQQRFGKFIAIAGLMGCIAMSLSLPLKVIVTGLMLWVIGFILRFVCKKAF
ncbi:MAG: amino acid permease [Flavobacteriaceae bacterium]|nr:amino acid permease [Flavobacteriaceae bacterium]